MMLILIENNVCFKITNIITVKVRPRTRFAAPIIYFTLLPLTTTHLHQLDSQNNCIIKLEYGCIWLIIPSRLLQRRNSISGVNHVSHSRGHISTSGFLPSCISSNTVRSSGHHHEPLFYSSVWFVDRFLDGFQASMFIPAPENNICYYYLRSNKEWRD